MSKPQANLIRCEAPYSLTKPLSQTKLSKAYQQSSPLELSLGACSALISESTHALSQAEDL